MNSREYKRVRYHRLKNDPKYRANRLKHKLKSKYNLSKEEFDLMVIAQVGRCLICRRVCKDLRIDHNHKSGEVRGLLCANCNAGLGHFHDSPKLMIRAVKYLLHDV